MNLKAVLEIITYIGVAGIYVSLAFLIVYIALFLKALINLLKVLMARAEEIESTIILSQDLVQSATKIGKTTENITDTFAQLQSKVNQFLSKSVINVAAITTALLKKEKLKRKLRGEK